MNYFSVPEAWIVIALILILAAAGWIGYSNRQRQTIEIKNGDWECVKSERRIYFQPTLIGKVTIMKPITRNVCVEYSRHTN